jgi:hypothetical protein
MKAIIHPVRISPERSVIMRGKDIKNLIEERSKIVITTREGIC